jgi:hypothetical protein
MAWKYRDMEASASRPGPPPPAPTFDATRAGDLRERAAFVGPPDFLVEQLQAIRDAVDVRVELIARSFLHTLPLAAQDELMERLAAEVAPHV